MPRPDGAAGRPLLSVSAAHVAPSSLSSRAALAVATGGLVTLASAGTALLVMTSTSAVVPSTDDDAQPLLGGQPGTSEVIVASAPRSVDAAAASRAPSRPAAPVLLAGSSAGRPVRVVLPGPLQGRFPHVPGAQGPAVPAFPTVTLPDPVVDPDPPALPPVAVPEAPDRPAAPTGEGAPVVHPHLPTGGDDSGSGSDRGKPRASARDKADEKVRSASPSARTGTRTDKVRAALRAESARMQRAEREQRFREALHREMASTARGDRGGRGTTRTHEKSHSSGHGRLAV